MLSQTRAVGRLFLVAETLDFKVTCSILSGIKQLSKHCNVDKYLNDWNANYILNILKDMQAMMCIKFNVRSNNQFMHELVCRNSSSGLFVK